MAHPHHNVIIDTHQYLSPDGSLSTSNGGYGDTSPKDLFDRLISAHPNIRLVFSGHAGGSARRLDFGRFGNPVLAVLSCFHDSANAQSTVVTIDPSANSASAVTYLNPGQPGVVAGTAFQQGGMNWVQ